MKCVVGAVACAGSRVFLARRLSKKDQGGLWEFPGGKVEEGESLEQALIRELHEELGLENVKVGAEFGRTQYDYPGGSILLICFWTEFPEEAQQGKGIVLTAHDAWVWAEAADLLDYTLAPADVPIAQQLQTILRVKTDGG